jgi:hypothetical protein
MAVGLGYPTVSLKYDFFEHFAAELKYASTGEGIKVYATRGYWTPHPAGKFRTLAGAEIGEIKFDYEDTQGTGLEYSLFVGKEYRIRPWLGFAFDMAPTIIQLNSGEKKNTGFELVANVGFYWYLF